MVIFGIDPGYGRCGIAVVEKHPGKDLLLFSDCIETDPRDEFSERLHTVVSRCEEVIDSYHPEEMVLEKLYFETNKKTAMQVAEVRGALLSLAAARRIPVSEYTPLQVKSAIAGYGGADKKQVQRMVGLLIVIKKPVARDDEYDAIAIALTHAARRKPSA